MHSPCTLPRSLRLRAASCAIICAAPLIALAADVPRDLRAVLNPFQTLSVSIEGQTLRIVMNAPSVSRATYEAVASAYCMPVVRSVTRRPWDGMPLRGIEVVNVTRAQGFAFSGTVVDCMQWSKLSPEAAKPFLDKRTLVCVGNECRPRLPGEVVVGE